MAVKIVRSNTSEAQKDGFLLGDAVEKIARPVAKAAGIDPGCAPCMQRKAALNELSRKASARIRQIFRTR